MSGRIPQSFIDELMNRVEIVDVIDARVPLKKAGREYTACCPFHNEKTPSFTVSPNKQFYHCFGCGAHGTAVGFLMDYEHMSFPEAVEELARQMGMVVPYEGPRPDTQQASKQSDELYAMLEEADRYYQQQLRQHSQAQRAVDYLKGRGLSGKIAADFGIGFAPPGWDNLTTTLGTDKSRQEQLVTSGLLIRKDDGGVYDRFRDRIMFPIRDRRGRPIGFGGRILPDTQEKGAKAPAKYLNSPETPLFHKGQELYGLYEARKALRDIPRLLVVEGYMDVVSLAQFEVRYAVATLGTATTQEHLQRLFRVTAEVVFCFDGDRAGRDAAWRALENALPVMREGRQIRFMFLPEGEDPDTQIRRLGKQAFEAEIEQASPFSEYLFNSLSSQFDTASIDGRAQLVERARPLLAQLSPGVYQQMMVNQLAQLARMEPMQIERALSTAAKTRPVSSQSPLTPSRRNMASKGKQQLSPVRIAIMRLLYQPSLARLAEDPQRFSGLDIPGLPLLIEVLETLQQHPNLSSSALLERWRGTENGPHLAKLALWQPEVDEEASLESEFSGAIKALDKLRLEHRYDMLMAKSDHGSLSLEEKTEIRQLSEQLFR